METTLTPYDDYRDSGHDWLGKIPAHWKMERAKWLFNKMERPIRPEDETITCFRDGEVTLRKNRRTEGFTESLKEIGYQGIRKGDLVVHEMDAFAGAVGVSDSDGKGSPVYTVCQPKAGISAEYFARVVGEMARSEYIAALATGIRERSTDFRYSTFSSQEVPVPPSEEQRRIARHLDDLTRRTDRLIDAKERLIALLEEQKQGVIQRAVTRGLPGTDAAMKPLGNRWFPRLPYGWGVVPLGRLIYRAADGPHHSPAYLDSGVPFLSTRNVKADRWALGDVKYISRSDYEEFCKRVVPEQGDVLYTKGGTTGVARVIDLDFDFQVWVHLAVLKPNRKYVDPAYLALALNSSRCYEQSQLLTRGATNQDLGLSRMKRIVLPLPPDVEQQRKIVADVDEHLAPVRRAMGRAHEEIDLIREYRTRLVSDVVTGKLDVREAAEPQPRRQKPTKTHAEDRAPAPFRRSTVAAGITDRLRGTKGFGRVQLQKVLVVSERHLELDLDIKAKRKELGPFDNNAMRSVHSQFERSKWFRPVKQHGTWRYDVLPKLDGYKKYFDGFIHSQTDEFERLMRLFEKMDSTQSEIVATLYMAWNDELIEGHTPSDEKLLDEVLNNWHPSKRNYPPERWQRALDWMRDPEKGNLIPTGFGPSTKED